MRLFTISCWWAVLLISLLLGDKVWLFITAQDPALPLSEILALQSVYEAAGGPQWSWKEPYSTHGNPWNFTDIAHVNPCQDRWQGIACTGTQPNHITVLSLRRLNLAGHISTNISSLTNLTKLQIIGNKLLLGPIPPQIGNLVQLKTLTLNLNRLNGPIPQQIGNLIQLKNLTLSLNKLTGSITSQIGNLSQLQILALDSNELTGSIPLWISNLTTLQYLGLSANMLTGSIPSQIGRLTRLQHLGLFLNKLTGSIPQQIGNLTLLQFLVLNSNKLTGPIPSSISNLTQLKELYLVSNVLTGSIPHQISDMVQLQRLCLNRNMLTGTILPQIGDLMHLEELVLGQNMLTGSIPYRIGDLSAMLDLSFYSNMLTGSIPSQIGNLSQLLNLYLYFNMLTGPIPHQIGSLTQVQLLYIYSNMLTGPIPPSIGNLTQLQFLYFYSNMLTGPIPPPIGNLRQLRDLYLSSNMLTGSIPQSIDHLTQLQTLYLSSNILIGTVDSSIFENLSLVSFSVSQNRLSGSFPTYIASKFMTFFDISDNVFTGALPSFYAPSSLTTAVFGVNCMRSAIPESYCYLHSIETLVLNGLNSAVGCGGDRDNGLYDSGLPSANRRDGISGGLPSCLFHLESLRNLQVSGNGIAGTLPDDADVSVMDLPSNLTTLDVSHNALVGTIPMWVWQHGRWEELDLSFNRLTGHLPLVASFEASSTSLSLNINRLSGDIPLWTKNISLINMLNGNIFGCAIDRSTVPSRDPYSASYTCGSDAVNSGLVVWGLVTVITIVMVIVYAGSTKVAGSAGVSDVVTFLALELITVNDARTADISTAAGTKGMFAEPLVKLCRWLVKVGVPVVLCCGMSLYGLNSIYFSVYESKYVWTVSACFLSGWVPAVSMLVFFVLLLSLVKGSIAGRLRGEVLKPLAVDADHDQCHQLRSTTLHGSRLERALIVVQSLLVLVIMMVVLVVNAAFVSALTQKSFGRGVLLVVTVSLSLFKICCSWFTMHRLRWSVFVITKALLGKHWEQVARSQWLSKQSAQLTLFLNIFNNVVTPYCAEMLVNADCFLYVWSVVPATTSLFNIPTQCFLFESTSIVQVICLPSLQSVLSFRPAYSYSYLCSSSLMSTFSFVFLSRYIISGLNQMVISLFLARWVSCRYSTSQPSITSAALASGDKSGLLWRAAWYVLPFNQRPLQWFIDTYELDRPTATGSLRFKSQTDYEPSRTDEHQKSTPPSMNTTGDNNHTVAFSLARLLPSHKAVAVGVVTDLSLLATYGVLFPPLGLVIGSAIFVDVYLLVHYHWERARRLVRLCPHLQSELTAIEQAFGRLDKSVYGSLDRVSYLVAGFWSFTLFDTLGAEVGALKAVWIVVVMCTAPGWIRLLLWAYGAIRGKVASVPLASSPSVFTVAAFGPGGSEVELASGVSKATEADAGDIVVTNPLVLSSSTGDHTDAIAASKSAMTEGDIELNAVDVQ